MEEILWFVSRAAGLVSLLLLTGTVVLGCAHATRASTGRWQRFTLHALHRNLSLLALVFLAVHIASAILDGYVPLQWVDAVVPFVSDYHPVWLGLGAIAFDLHARRARDEPAARAGCRSGLWRDGARRLVRAVADRDDPRPGHRRLGQRLDLGDRAERGVRRRRRRVRNPPPPRAPPRHEGPTRGGQGPDDRTRRRTRHGRVPALVPRLRRHDRHRPDPDRQPDRGRVAAALRGCAAGVGHRRPRRPPGPLRPPPARRLPQRRGQAPAGREGGAGRPARPRRRGLPDVGEDGAGLRAPQARGRARERLRGRPVQRQGPRAPAPRPAPRAGRHRARRARHRRPRGRARAAHRQPAHRRARQRARRAGGRPGRGGAGRDARRVRVEREHRAGQHAQHRRPAPHRRADVHARGCAAARRWCPTWRPSRTSPSSPASATTGTAPRAPRTPPAPRS